MRCVLLDIVRAAYRSEFVLALFCTLRVEHDQRMVVILAENALAYWIVADDFGVSILTNDERLARQVVGAIDVGPISKTVVAAAGGETDPLTVGTEADALL